MNNRSRLVAVLAGIAAVFFIVVLPLLSWIAGVYTDLQWYADLGQTSVFWTRIVSQIVIGVVFGTLAFLVLFATMRVARSMAPKTSGATPIGFPDTVPVQIAEAIERFRSGLGPILDKAVLGGAAVLGFLNGLAMSAQWETFRIAAAGATFGYNDPQFGRDIGWWVFRMPALESVLSWSTDLLILATLLTLVVHVADGAIQPWAKLKGFAPHVKAHLSVLLAFIVLTRAYGYWLDIWMLNLSLRGQVAGASYTDVHAQLPAYWILIGISIVTAGLLLLNIRTKGWRLPAIAIGVWVGAAIIVGGIYPAIIQRFAVAPNEARLEQPYIDRNIEMTRKAFDLAEVKTQPFAASDTLTAADVTAEKLTVGNVRLWDPSIVKQSYGQLQTLRPYYEFADVDVDRYIINGAKRQVLVSAREMNSSMLADTAQTWVNRHLVYTHGFGLVMSPASEFDSRGLPRFYVGDIPPKLSSAVATNSPAIVQKQPRIYFGEDTTEYVIVDTSLPEFDYPLGEKNATYTYKGSKGVKVGGLMSRIAWAMRLGSSQVLFSSYIKPDSRVLMRRDLTSRLNELAPWLSFEDDPYPVIVDGRIVWIIDAYTHSEMYPYSQPLSGGVNYLRNSVKVTVDAFTGETTFYAFDETDPVLKAWRSVFPTLITSGDKIPAAIREHFRYPEGLFSAQAEVYRTYHMTDTQVFYNKEDQWQIPGEAQGKPMAPFFVLLQLPGNAEEHFYLMQPYTPRNRDNMIGWMAASSDPEDYGKRTVYEFPKERVILGPEQISARINQDSAISPQLSLWNQRGSRVLFGNMVVIPLKNSIVYVQPLFLQAEQTAIPELTRVIVAYADKVEMARTLEEALLKVFGQTVPVSEPATGNADGSGAGSPAVTASRAARLYKEAVDAQKKGDWALYGTKIAELGRVLEALASNQATPAAKP